MTCYAGRVDDERCSGTLHCKAKRNGGRQLQGTCRDLELTECVVDDDRGAHKNDRRQHKSERRAHNLMKSESEGGEGKYTPMSCKEHRSAIPQHEQR